MTALANARDIVPDAIERAEILFGEWLPDIAPYNNPGAIEALNVIPTEGAYVPFPQLGPSSVSVLPDKCIGATAVVSDDDTVQLYAGTTGGLYGKIGPAFTLLLAAPVSDVYNWQFVRVNEQMVMIHPDRVPQRSPAGTLTIPVDVGGTPPKAACGAQVNDFLMLGNLFVDPDDFGGRFPSRVRWSGHNNIDMPWITSPAAQSDFQDMPPEGGAVTAISGREYGTIFQQRMIHRATYRGLPAVFDIVMAEDKRGCIARDSVIDVGPAQFFIAEDGFFVWNGTNSEPIGDGKVNRYFFARLNYAARNNICGAVDFATGTVMWAFPTDSSGLLNEIIIFSYRENRWSHSIQTLEYLFNSAMSNIVLEDLTEPLETYTESFDSDFYRQGGRARVAAFNQDHEYGLFDGPPMAAILDTGEYSGASGRRVFVNNVRPLVNLQTPVASVQVAMRDQMLGQPLLFSYPTAQEIDGQCPIIADARYMRFRVNLPVDVLWTHAQGIEVSRKSSGAF